ncbi:ASCH domain-containing protein [Corynebacterium minutissimum]|uniref:ASCH domain n=1 Tax=Corynebacterium minutissimum TaxID=38301 RepID=A0A2X4RWB5_9CORY|nr:ASCH domain-containing protein [Corynebacterium minutissimum]KHO30045.1 RNA-binding protein [Corynebacterium minutissimum]QPS60530.1 ASCH domain-containing protein [Corynebacterium minutissimum]QQA78682.1 ASCH domain-containing protein [Corynebacterium minutissimum]SQI00610.1 ASCH domain [Corynebacterium minutissimum]VEG05322.1 ASCH domain [Corynebacterium minutissimum]
MTQYSLVHISELPRGEFAFPGPLRDALVNAILDGMKTTTTSFLDEYPLGHDPREGVDTLEAVLDSHDTVVCVIRTTEVQICRLADVSDEHAIAEGEGSADASEWRAGHEKFWRSPEFVECIGQLDINDDTQVVSQRFTIDSRYPTRSLVPWDAET